MKPGKPRVVHYGYREDFGVKLITGCGKTGKHQSHANEYCAVTMTESKVTCKYCREACGITGPASVFSLG